VADWTELDTDTLLPGEPLTSAKALAFFENPIALAEGAADAPSLYVGLAAKLVAGGLGSLVFAYSTGGDVAFGGTVAGSALRPVGAARSVGGNGGSSVVAVLASGSALTGTWTCLGYFDSTVTDTVTVGSDQLTITIQGATLWQRTL